MICKRKLKGGLRIINFQKQNATLLIKFLDKFYNKKDIPWVHLVWFAHYQGKVPNEENLCGSFWWRDVCKQVDNFRGVAFVNHGTGETASFWHDSWNLAGSKQSMSQRFPKLFSYVLNDKASIAHVYQREDILDLFYTHLSMQAFQELLELQSLMQDNPLTSEKDRWQYCWGMLTRLKHSMIRSMLILGCIWFMLGCGNRHV
jgi:hypothetical protein